VGFSFQTVYKHSSAATNQERNSVLVNKDIVLDNSYIETAIFSLFKVDILNMVKVKAILAKEFHIQPSEIEKMPAWEFEIFMREINEAVKAENERNKQEMDKAGIKDAQKMSNPNHIQKMQKAAMPQMPKMPNINVSTPKM
jgi:hypothetical protein